MPNRNQRRSRHPAKHLKLWDVVDGTVITTTGTYLRGLRLRGIDSIHTDAALLLGAAKTLYKGFQADFPDHGVIQLLLRSHDDYGDVFDRFAETAPTNPLLAHQRRRRVEFLQSCGLRRHELYAFIGSLRYYKSTEFARISRSWHAEKLHEVDVLTKNLTGVFHRAGLPSSPLGTDEILNFLAKALNLGHAGSTRRRFPEHLAEEDLRQNPQLRPVNVREQLFQSKMRLDDDYVQIGDQYASVLTLRRLPDETRVAADLETFLDLPFDFWLSTTVRFPDQADVRRSFERRRNIIHSIAHRRQHIEDAVRVAKADEAHSLSHLLSDSGQKLVLLGSQILVIAPSPEELAERLDTIQKKLKAKETVYFEETLAHDRELFKVLPGMGALMDRHLLVTSNNAVDCLPLYTADHGDRDPVLLVETARQKALFSFNPVEEVRDNWNAAVFGSPGSGKSVWSNMLITSGMLSCSQTRGRLMVVDFAGETKSSYLMVAKLFGGRFVPFLSDTAPGINPFPAPDKALGPDGQVKPRVVNFLVVLTDVLLANEGTDKDAALFRIIIQRAIADTYSRCAGQTPIYGDLLETLKTYTTDDRIDQERLHILIDLLAGFLSGANARIFNQRTDDIQESFVVYDLFGVDSLPPNVAEAVVFMVCEHVKNVAFDAEDSGYKYIILDEVAQLIKRQSMESLIDELFATSRKHNTSVWSVTQKYSTFRGTKLASTANQLATTLILLSHSGDEKAREALAEDFGMSERERHLFRSLRTVKGKFSEVLIKTEAHDPIEDKRSVCARLRVRLSPFDYEIATSDALDRQRQARYLDAHPGKPLVEVLDYIAEQHRGTAA